MHGRAWATFGLDGVKHVREPWLAHALGRRCLDLLEGLLAQRLFQGAPIDRPAQLQRRIGQLLVAALGVGLEVEVPPHPGAERVGVGIGGALVDFGLGWGFAGLDLAAGTVAQGAGIGQRDHCAVLQHVELFLSAAIGAGLVPANGQGFADRRTVSAREAVVVTEGLGS